MSMFEFTETSYIAKVWFVAYGQDDWMAVLHKNNAVDAKWQFGYRFRYYGKPAVEGVNDPFTDDDTKNFYGGTMEGSEDEIVAKLDLIAKTIAQARGGQLFEVPIRGDVHEFMKEFKKQPWAHMRHPS